MATFGFRGSTRMREIAYDCGKPARTQWRPLSVLRQTPSPYEASLRGADSPVPAHTTFGWFGAIATAPIAPTESAGHTSCQERPPFSVLKTPPPAEPR